jgi:hypothetical protein
LILAQPRRLTDIIIIQRVKEEESRDWIFQNFTEIVRTGEKDIQREMNLAAL